MDKTMNKRKENPGFDNLPLREDRKCTSIRNSVASLIPQKGSDVKENVK